MAAKDYAWLKASILDRMHRTDLTTRVDDFILLAEDRLNMDLDSRLQAAKTTLTTTKGVQTVTLPDVASVSSVSIACYGDVEYVSVSQFFGQYDLTTTGMPRDYTVVGTSMYLGPTPDTVYSLIVITRAKLAALADAVGGTNWLIAAHPSLYLAAAMCEAYLYTKDTASLGVWEQKYQNALSLVNGTDADVASSLVIRTDTKTP